jgi:hypothetical protein
MYVGFGNIDFTFVGVNNQVGLKQGFLISFRIVSSFEIKFLRLARIVRFRSCWFSVG